MFPCFTFIRHGQSDFNVISQRIEKENATNPHWKQTPEYKKYKYSQSLMDAGLTEKGKSEARQAKKIIQMSDVDLVIVSPLRRALQTCDIIFGGEKNIKIVVEPLLSENLTSAVDIGASIGSSIEKWGNIKDQNKFDFSRVEAGSSQRWYLDYIIGQQDRKEILQLAAYENINTHQATLRILRDKPLTNLNKFNQRIQKLKQQLILYNQKTSKRLVIVAHSGSIKHLTATGYHPHGEAVNGLFLGNCQVRDAHIVIEGYEQQSKELIPFCSAK